MRLSAWEDDSPDGLPTHIPGPESADSSSFLLILDRVIRQERAAAAERAKAVQEQSKAAVSGAVRLWGTAQLLKLAEEAGELAAAAIRFKLDASRNKLDSLAEEAADVLLCLESLYLLFPGEAEPLVMAWREKKRERLGFRVAAGLAERERAIEQMR